MSPGHEEGQGPRKAQQSSGSSTTNLARLASASPLGKFTTWAKGVIAHHGTQGDGLGPDSGPFPLTALRVIRTAYSDCSMVLLRGLSEEDACPGTHPASGPFQQSPARVIRTAWSR